MAIERRRRRRRKKNQKFGLSSQMKQSFMCPISNKVAFIMLYMRIAMFMYLSKFFFAMIVKFHSFDFAEMEVSK